METHEWIWMMDYCKKQGLPPAQKWAWDQAKRAFNTREEE